MPGPGGAQIARSACRTRRSWEPKGETSLYRTQSQVVAWNGGAGAVYSGKLSAKRLTSDPPGP